MTATDSHADRDQRLDAAVAAYLKAREDDPRLDGNVWSEKYPDLKAELADFFSDQNRLDELASLLHVLTGDAETATAMNPTLDCQSPTPDKQSAEQHALGDYEILEEIGKGGMGRVYKARQRSLKRIVALKVILAGPDASTEDWRRFHGEAVVVANLEHPNIVQIHEEGELNGLPFFALEYVNGGSLERHLQGTPMPARSAAEMVRTLAEAIHFAHQQGVIHRDLKPANVLLARGADGTPVAKITDFGLAKRLDDDSGQTKSGMIVGTPSYMAPEQAAGHNHRLGPATDIYGLGAVLYELLTGRPPFKADTPWETVNQVLHDEPVSPRLLVPSIKRDLETICLKCLQKEPGNRYESAQAMADDLRRFLEGRPILARPVSSVRKLWRLCKRHPLSSASLAFTLVSLLVLVIATAGFNHRLQQALTRNESINRELQFTLTRQAADRIDTDLRLLTRIPDAMVVTLAQRTGWCEPQLDAWMREMLARDARLFGIAVAFEPRQFDAGRDDFAKYVYRIKDSVKTKALLLPGYKPHYRNWLWYSPVKQHNAAQWSEPFLDQGGGDISMVTYSAPIRRAGQFAGVVTGDLSLAYFESLRQSLDQLKLGDHGYAFVVSQTGTFIGHPDARFQMPMKITQAPAFQTDDALHAMTRQMLAGETGTAHAIDPASGVPSVFTFAPITSAKWSFVVVTRE